MLFGFLVSSFLPSTHYRHSMNPSHKRRRRESDEGASQRVFPFDSPWSPPVPAWSEHTSTQWQPYHGRVPMEWNLKPVSWVCYGMVRLIVSLPPMLEPIEDIQVHAPP